MKTRLAWLGLIALTGAALTTGCPSWEKDLISVAPDAAPPAADGAAAADARAAVDVQDTDASAPPADPIWPADATRLEALEGWGFGPRPSDACLSGHEYTYARATRLFTWDRCEARNDLVRAIGSRTLTAEEADRLEVVAGRVKPAGPNPVCGADKAQLGIQVTTPRGERVFVDSFYACQKQSGVTYVTDIEPLFAELRALARAVTAPADAGAADAGVSDAGGRDAGGPDTGPAGDAAPGGIWPADASTLEASEGLGFGPQPSEACRTPNTYAFTRATRSFTWDRCATRMDLARSQGTRALAADEAARLEAAVAKVKAAAPDGPCGADKGTLQLHVTTPAGKAIYVDSFYRCQKQPGVTYVDEIEQLFVVLRDLSRP